LLDVPTLVGGEREAGDDPSGLRRVVVLDRGLEMLANLARLGELPSQPAEEAHLCGFDSHFDGR